MEGKKWTTNNLDEPQRLLELEVITIYEENEKNIPLQYYKGIPASTAATKAD